MTTLRETSELVLRGGMPGGLQYASAGEAEWRREAGESETAFLGRCRLEAFAAAAAGYVIFSTGGKSGERTNGPSPRRARASERRHCPRGRRSREAGAAGARRRARGRDGKICRFAKGEKPMTTTVADVIRTELSAMADAQERADAVYQQLGMGGSPPPWRGETVADYRRRLLLPLLPYSAAWRDVPGHSIIDQVLPIAEQGVYADAQREAERPSLSVPAGTMREVRKKNGHAGECIEFFTSDGSTFISTLKRPSRRVLSIGTAEQRAARAMAAFADAQLHGAAGPR